ncbi:hypothetical protein [Zunongwangia sp. H14]|uniref:hypothetical protein n=1 Tax=Zunongwangia sp. H14 TaxID=3240792 RepID=UPI00356131BF
MKHFDIEIYVRSKLEDYSLKPGKDSWQEFVQKLDKKEQKNFQKRLFAKTALFISFFMIGFFPLSNKTNRQFMFSFINTKADVDPTEAGNASEERANGLHEKNISAAVIPNERERKEISSITETEKSAPLAAKATNKENMSSSNVLSAYYKTSEELKLKEVKVTDVEVDSLLKIAFKKIENEKINLQEQEWSSLPAKEILAEATVIENEMPANYRQRNLAIDNFIWELLKIKSAFAN